MSVEGPVIPTEVEAVAPIADVSVYEAKLWEKPLDLKPIPESDLYAKFKSLQQRVEFLDIQARDDAIEKANHRHRTLARRTPPSGRRPSPFTPVPACAPPPRANASVWIAAAPPARADAEAFVPRRRNTSRTR